MRLPVIVFLATLLVFSSLGAADAAGNGRAGGCRHGGSYGDCDVDWNEDEGTLTLTNEDNEDETVVITKKYKLIVNGETVKMDRKQKEIVRKYYKGMKRLHELAAEIGAEGAELGERAGSIAAIAVKKALKLRGDEDALEDFEEEIEREAEKLEAEAEKIEEKAEEIEDYAEELEDLHEEMRDAIPELRELDWL